MKSTKYARMTQPVIQKFNENSCRSMPAKLYIQIANCSPKLSRRTNRILRIATHPLHADCGLGTQGPIIAAPYLHFAQLQSKIQVRKKNMEKNIVSVMENVLLILFCRDVLLIFRPLWLTAEIWYFFLRFGNFLHACLVIALQNIWSHWFLHSCIF